MDSPVALRQGGSLQLLLRPQKRGHLVFPQHTPLWLEAKGLLMSGLLQPQDAQEPVRKTTGYCLIQKYYAFLS